MNTGILDVTKSIIRVVFFGAPAFYMALCIFISHIDKQIDVHGYLIDSIKVWLFGLALLFCTECCTDPVYVFLMI